MRMSPILLKVTLLSLMVLLHVTPSDQLGGGCIVADQEEITLNYQQQFPVHTTPSVQAVHLSLHGPNSMKVVWMNPSQWTDKSNFSPACSLGASSTVLNVNSTGIAYSYPDGNFMWTLNTAILNLSAVTPKNGVYYYRCGDDKFGWSDVFNFTRQPTNAEPSDSTLYWRPGTSVVDPSTEAPTIALIADHGVTHGEHTTASITEHVNSGKVQMLIHAGDISYADKYGGKSHNNSEVWVEYMNRLQPIVSRVPYMVSPGNHEAQFDFAAYLNWLKMPSNESSSASPFWYSFDYMGIHFTSISTEHDFSQNSTQYKWIEADLKKANQNRNNVPWIIVFGHRPLYCSSIVCIERCDIEAPKYRAELEDLLYYQNVNIYLSGHNHQYERSFPVYKKLIDRLDYTNALSPVYIVNGAAGNPELNDPTFTPFVKWRAFDEPTLDTGYLLLTPSRERLFFQYVLSKEDKVVDSFTMTRTPYK